MTLNYIGSKKTLLPFWTTLYVLIFNRIRGLLATYLLELELLVITFPKKALP